ncbi:hypothetical protein F4778DRAFT_123823 [Xylariomycetidae sp. FL2044]|nr:hypothetical protein F4778DRAFT_123823 [Xylariomycetidae sp. FL2044]
MPTYGGLCPGPSPEETNERTSNIHKHPSHVALETVSAIERMLDDRSIVVYIDGLVQGGGLGSFGVYFRKDSKYNFARKMEGSPTKQAVELYAVRHALRIIKDHILPDYHEHLVLDIKDEEDGKDGHKDRHSFAKTTKKKSIDISSARSKSASRYGAQAVSSRLDQSLKRKAPHREAELLVVRTNMSCVLSASPLFLVSRRLLEYPPSQARCWRFHTRRSEDGRYGHSHGRRPDHAVWACRAYSHVNPKVNVFQTDMLDFIPMDRNIGNVPDRGNRVFSHVASKGAMP